MTFAHFSAPVTSRVSEPSGEAPKVREARSVERIVPNDHRSSNAVDDAMQTQRTTRNNATRTLRATVARRARARIDMTARACPGGGRTVIGIWLTEAREPSDTEG